jgi:single-stranded-DNA-specific exonuclease
MEKTVIRRSVFEEHLSSAVLHPLLKRIYCARGIQMEDELERSLENLLHFSTLKGIDQAVLCLNQALRKQQHILILGDFDADGATSSALGVSALRRFGAQRVSYLVPNRFEYGYGLTPEIVEVAAQRRPDLIITVDNGISSVEGVSRAKTLGMQVIVTDHHLPGDKLPDADAIVNPNQPGDLFLSKNIAGVGVIFYVMLALRSHLRNTHWFIEQDMVEPNMSEFLDLVALGTVADVVSLDKNNRILVSQGLNRIRAGKARYGIQALLDIAQRQSSRVVANDLAFAVGPRLNAAGRLEDMSLGIECLLATDISKAQQLAMRLDALNKERRDIENSMQQQAMAAISKLTLTQNLPIGICLHDESWHQGVIGIVAARIKDRLHRPVIAFARVSEEELKGSARSVPGLNIRDALDAIAKRSPRLIHKFGGHAMAAGLSLHPTHYSDFSQAFAEEVGRHLSLENLQGKLLSDGELSRDDLVLEVADILRESGPWGQGFPEPLFDNYFFVVEQRIVGFKHLKMQLSLPENPTIFDAIAFNVDLEKWPNHRVRKVHAAYRLDVNEFRGQRNVQLLIEYLAVAQE